MENIKLYYNGSIYTVEENMEYAEAMAVEGKRITAIGNLAEVEKAIEGKSIERIDLEGKFMMPGFVESHAHPAMAGPEMIYQVDLSACGSKEEYLEEIKEFYMKNSKAKMIRGVGWINPIFDMTGPRKEWLDEISTEIPIIMVSGDHHSIWANSKAFEMAGIDSNTEDIAGGVIERDPKTKEPFGTLREEAQMPMMAIIPEYTVEEYEKSWLNYQEFMAAYGVTMVHDAWTELNSNAHKAVHKLASEEKLLFKAAASIYTYANDLDYIDQIVEEGKKLNAKSFFVNHAKFFLDGVVEGGTVCLKEPYANNPNEYGEKLWTDEKLTQAFIKLDNGGIWPHVHVIGDAVMSQTLDALEKVVEVNGKKDRRSIAAHAQIVAEEDKKRIVDVGLTISANPYWFYKEEGYYYGLEVPILGEERASKEYPMKSLMEAGAVVASASDFSVTPDPNPLKGMMGAVLRCLPEEMDDPEKILGVEERITIAEAIKSFTINGAYTMNMEEGTGSLKVGKFADFIILDKNILEIPPEELGDAKVLMTFSEGKLIYKAD